MQTLNESLQSIGESSIKKKRLGEGKYPTSKVKRTEKAVKTRIRNIMAGVSGTHSVLCMYNSQKCEVNVGSLQNI
jgi:hypothetical protein